MRVLVIEDDREVVNYLRLGLEEFGVVVDVVADGRDGYQLAREPPSPPMARSRSWKPSAWQPIWPIGDVSSHAMGASIPPVEA